MRSRRPRTALLLTGMGIVLLLSVVAGQQIGEHTIFGATQRRVDVPEQMITPVPEETSSNEAIARNWKRLQVVSVATDPAFPDPRVTPPPTPSPRPTPSPKPRPTVNPTQIYTSPALALPLASHEPGETSPP
jgi:hypothetical protein